MFEDPANMIGPDGFSLDRLLSHIDPGTKEEAEEFVRRIYEQRGGELSREGDGKTGG